MAFLPRPVTMMIVVRPAATASSTTYWMMGLSTRGSISLGCALVAGRKRVPSPAAGKTALRMRVVISFARRTPDASASHASTGSSGPCAILALMLDLRLLVEDRAGVMERMAARGLSEEQVLA